ncbi:BLUF domain-containing protein [Neisseriaceae bacterium TC5R-5]|nr:BLUF domain-containing protein [Neisseriaceae bacterium TC5R-5]
MIRLIYSSAAIAPVEPEQIATSLMPYQQYNEQHGIRSLLLMLNNDFLQILEGSADEVDMLYQHIAHDHHHHQLTLLSRETIAEPMLADHPLQYFAPGPPGEGETLSYHMFNAATGQALQGKPQQVVSSFLEGKWHHHLPNGMNPQVLRRG